MSDSTYRDFLDGLKGIYRFAKEISLTFESYRSWYQKNAATINAYLNAFADFGVWCLAVQKMSERQIVFTDDLTNEFAKNIYVSPDIDATVLGYYLKDNEAHMNALITRCTSSRQIEDFETLYEQIISAYRNGHFQLACVGLFAMLDGILSEISLDEDTSFKKRIVLIQRKITDRIELSNWDKRLWCIYVSLDSFMGTVSANEPFKKDEPKKLNRNWLIHGRTRKQYTKLDFLKALLALDAVIVLDNAGNYTSSTEMEQ